MKLFEAILKDPNDAKVMDTADELPDTELIKKFIQRQITRFFHDLPSAEVVYIPSFLTPMGVKPLELDEYFRQRTEGMVPMCVELTQKNYIMDETWADIKTWFERTAIGKVFELKGRHLKVMKIDLYNNKMSIITFKIMKDFPAKDVAALPVSEKE
jgi:hypothetical protein